MPLPNLLRESDDLSAGELQPFQLLDDVILPIRNAIDKVSEWL